MKKIFYSILVAGLALVSASCQKTDEQFINQAPVSGKSLTVTGSIAGFEGTKVNYEFTETDKPRSGIKAYWAINDIIFGFDDKNGTFKFRVTDIKDGKAIFSDISGGNGYTPAQDVDKLYAVYYPGIDRSFSEGKLDVDLSSQNGTLGSLTPAIMCATGTINNGCVHFEFANQTAIVGIYKMQIFDGGTPVGENVGISSVTLNNVNTTGTIKCYGENNENFGLVPDIEEFGDITAEFKDGEKLVTGENGKIEVTSSALKPYFAVIPSNDNDVNFTVTASDGTNEYSTTGLITGKLPTGTYTYVGKVMDIPVASITKTGAKYFTIDDALDAAIELKTATIKLLSDSKLGKKVNLGSGIDLTLDLNGQELTVKDTNKINVQSATAKLTIIDGSEKKAGKYIQTEAGEYATSIGYGGVFTLESGTIDANEGIYVQRGTVNINGGIVNISSKEGSIYATQSNSIVNIKGGEVNNSIGSAVYAYNGTVNISDGKLSGTDSAGVRIAIVGSTSEVAPEVNISGGEISSVNSRAVYIRHGHLTITGGTFSASSSQVLMAGNLKNDSYIVDIKKGENIPDSQFTTSGTYAVIYAYGSGTINIESGKFKRKGKGSNGIIAMLGSGTRTVTLSGGHFSDNQWLETQTEKGLTIKSGFKLYDDGTGDYKYYIGVTK